MQVKAFWGFSARGEQKRADQELLSSNYRLLEMRGPLVAAELTGQARQFDAQVDAEVRAREVETGGAEGCHDRARAQDDGEEAQRVVHLVLGELGAELDLYSFPEEVGPGLPVFHPKGGVIKREMEDYVRQRHIEEGFQYVGTPHIAKEGLFYTSGHLPYYGEGMFDPFDVDGMDYRLKAMNCPMHNLIYRSKQRSYRELPLRLFEFGHVYRHEKSGVIHGLTRVRGLTQDDSHSYVTPEQAPGEIQHLLDFCLSLFRDFGLDPAQLAIAWVTSRPFVTSNIIGATSMEQLATDLGAREIVITPEIEERIDAVHQLHGNPAP